MSAAPPRTLLVHTARRQSVEVRLEGRFLVVVNDDGEAARRSFGSEAEASAELEKVIAAALAAGFVRAEDTEEALEEDEEDPLASGDDEDLLVSPEDGEKPPARNPALEAAILAAPDDPSNYEVYGDWLQAQGDPRGKLIAMQCQAARGNHRAALAGQDFRAANAWWLYGPSHEQILPVCEMEWRFGFVRSLTFKCGPRDLLGTVLDLPAMRFLRALDLSFQHEYGGKVPSPVNVLAAHAQAAPTILSLALRLPEAADLQRLGAIFPNLERLLLRASEIQGTYALPALRELDVGPEVAPAVLAGLAASKSPALETLRVDATRLAIGDLHPLLDGKVFRTVRHLALTGFQHLEELFGELERSPSLARLKTLDLHGGALHEVAAKKLIAVKGAFAHLEWLELGHHRLGDKAKKRLEKAIPNARFTEREAEPPLEADDEYDGDDEDGERYDDTGE